MTDMGTQHRPLRNSISRTSGVSGESLGFLVMRYRSTGAWVWREREKAVEHNEKSHKQMCTGESQEDAW